MRTSACFENWPATRKFLRPHISFHPLYYIGHLYVPQSPLNSINSLSAANCIGCDIPGLLLKLLCPCRHTYHLPSYNHISALEHRQNGRGRSRSGEEVLYGDAGKLNGWFWVFGRVGLTSPQGFVVDFLSMSAIKRSWHKSHCLSFGYLAAFPSLLFAS